LAWETAFKIDDLIAIKDVAVPGVIIQSTVVLLRVLNDNNAINTVHGHVVVGWLVIGDILTVLILVVLFQTFQ
jgi:predicted Kef-type K+ transport protein